MPSIGKAIRDITESDLLALMGQTEDEQIEFKGCVPHEEEADEWAETGDLTKFGVNKLLRSIVAFANSYGGDLIIGVDEGNDKVGKAAKLAPIPNCMDLAQRLSQRAQDLIDPPIPSLQSRGIPLSEDGAGVVVLRVGRSRLAPHRHEGLKECFQRVRHEIRKMSMRQVQELTFSVSRGLDRVERRFQELRASFDRWAQYNQHKDGFKRLCFRVVCVPLSEDFALPKVHNVTEVRPGLRTPTMRPNLGAKPIQLNPPGSLHSWKPILRGSEGSGGTDDRARVTVYCDGAVAYNFRIDAEEPDDVTHIHEIDRRHVIRFEWLFGVIVNAMEAADNFRTFAGASAAEYGLEFEIDSSHSMAAIRKGAHGFNEIRGTFEHGQHAFPMYPIGARQSWPTILTVMWRDYWNFIGVAVPDEVIELDPA